MPADPNSLLVKGAFDEIMKEAAAVLKPLNFGYDEDGADRDLVKLEEGAQELPETLTVEFKDLGIENFRTSEDPGTTVVFPISIHVLAFELELYGHREKVTDSDEKSLEFWEAFEGIIDLPYKLNGLSRTGHKYGRAYYFSDTEGDDYAATRKDGIRKIKLTLICEARRIK